eukprot:TRINITY_DN7356_c0_g3_i1.p1 TRINITY_DN7356_c0_g3~~TRINITY_DN7356_c0_g3_i1.p1  ORF type:complete len:272 (+),score=36.68 TRINITY_DN7356_c0_g3_i1:120-935(+)
MWYACINASFSILALVLPGLIRSRSIRSLLEYLFGETSLKPKYPPVKIEQGNSSSGSSNSSGQIPKDEEKDIPNSDDYGLKETQELDTVFELALSFVGRTLFLSNQQRLFLYGFVQQAIEGDCNVPKPNENDIIEIRKWESWKSRRNIPKAAAKYFFISYVRDFLPTFDQEISEINENSKSQNFKKFFEEIKRPSECESMYTSFNTEANFENAADVTKLGMQSEIPEGIPEELEGENDPPANFLDRTQLTGPVTVIDTRKTRITSSPSYLS